MSATVPPERVIVIPARHGSARFPGKPLAMLADGHGTRLPLIVRTWRTACRVPGIARVIVATDDARIAETAYRFGAEVMMTPASCRNGTERCAAVLDQLPNTPALLVNVQGDAPLTPPDAVVAAIARLEADPALGVATPAIRRARDRAGLRGEVTVRLDHRLRARDFERDAGGDWLHLGVYAYRPQALRAYAAGPPGAAELAAGLEQLRFRDLAIPVGVACCPAPRLPQVECNYPADLARIEAVLARATAA